MPPDSGFFHVWLCKQRGIGQTAGMLYENISVFTYRSGYSIIDRACFHCLRAKVTGKNEAKENEHENL
ncbi:hypothetical protein C2H91_07040 [Bacillus subtilis]|nr:hypothetical protein C2H91_07040 [Bacillus subtilis]